MKPWILRPVVVCVLCVSSRSIVRAEAGQATGQKAAQPAATRDAPKITPRFTQDKVVIDGVLDEKAWAEAPAATHFIQSEPHEGQPATEDTEVRILYDHSNLYFGVYAYDSEPQKIIISELKKDFTTDTGDAFEIILDTFHDQRNGFRFTTNPGGAKWDAQMVKEGRETNASWDSIWYVKTQITDRGWTAEVAIPFKTLRFSSASAQTWGMNFVRRLRRKFEESAWAPLPRIYKIDRVSLAGTLENLEGIKQGNNLKIKPYVTGTFSQTRIGPDNDNVLKGSGGGDLKYGIGSGLTLDLTYNTDFSQVEADDQQINLTRFSLFFPEKREFFLENSGIFQYGQTIARPSTIGNGVGGGGRALQSAAQEDFVLFFSRRIGLSNDGSPIPILGGGRLTGVVGNYEIGILDIQTKDAGPEPATNFFVARARRNVLANSDIGAMFINKQPSGGRFNRVAGVDANFRFFQKLTLSSFLAKSDEPGAHGKDAAGRFYAAFQDKRYEIRSIYTNVQENFDDQVGFVPQTGFQKWNNSLGMRFRPKLTSTVVREYYPHGDFDLVYRPDGKIQTRYVNFHLPLYFQNSSAFEIGRNYDFERLDKPFKVQGNVTIPVGDYGFVEYFFLANTDQSKRLAAAARISTAEYYDGHRKSFAMTINGRVNYRLNGMVSWTRNNITLPTARFSTDLLAIRANYSFSTSMFLNALVQYNSTTSQWSSNIRFNIIHHPLSDFFLVYNDRRDSISGSLIDRSLAVKLTYMFAF